MSSRRDTTNVTQKDLINNSNSKSLPTSSLMGLKVNQQILLQSTNRLLLCQIISRLKVKIKRKIRT